MSEALEFLNSDDCPNISYKTGLDMFIFAEIMQEYANKQLLIQRVSQQRELLYAVCDKLAEAIHKHPLPPSLKSAIINEVLADNCG